MLRKTSIKIATGARQPAIKITPRVPSSPSAPPGTASTAAPPGTIQQILPEHVGYSPWNTRHPSAFKDDEFCRLQADISSARGNTIPIKVRRRRPSPAWFNTSQKIETYEVVYGHRRHQACLQLGIPVLAVVEDLDDHHLVAEMLTENDNRKTLSAWELGDLFRLMLDRGLYPTQTALARALARDEGDVSRALRVRAIPTEILSAVDTPTGFALHDGDRLSRALKGRSGGGAAYGQGSGRSRHTSNGEEIHAVDCQKGGRKAQVLMR